MLMIHLPLNGDLHNQGLANTEVTNNGATVDNNGKIGKCYSFDGTSKYIFLTNPFTDASEISCSIWIKPLANTSTNEQIINIGTSNGWNNIRFGILQRSNNQLLFHVSDGTNNITYSCYSSAINLNEWIHIVCTYKNRELKMYLNGELAKTYSISFDPSFSGISKIGIGAAPNGAEKFTGFINDVKIFSHCLSQKEISELKKMLILHYPLDGNNGTLANPNLLTKATSEFSNWTNINPDCVTITSDNYKNVYLLTQGKSGKWENVYSPAITVETNKEYTISCLYKVYDDYNYTTSYGNFGLTVMKAVPTNVNPNSNTIARASFKNIAGGFWKAQATFTPTVSTIYLNMCGGSIVDGQTNKKFDVNYIKLEEGHTPTPWCPNSSDALYTTLGYDDGIEYDTSGYGNNGTYYIHDSTGDIVYSINSPRYLASTQLLSANSSSSSENGTVYLYGNCFIANPNQLTIAFWCKAGIGYGGGTQQGQFCTTNGDYGNASCGRDYLESAMNHRDSAIDVNNSTGDIHLRLPVSFTQDEWHHYAFTYDGQTAKAYKDGVQTSSVAFSSATPLGSFKAFVLGLSRAGGAWRRNTSTYSDARVYVTCLSAEEIQKLYTVSASIDSNGNAYSAAYVEG